MNISKYRKTLSLVAVLVIIICGLAIIYATTNENVAYNSENISYKYQYMLKEQSGQIGVFKSGEDNPFGTLDVYVTNLPVVDQYELAQGIYIENDEKLRAIIEDFTS